MDSFKLDHFLRTYSRTEIKHKNGFATQYATKIMLKINAKTINATQSSKNNENATSTCLCCNHRLFYTKISHIATL